MKIEKEIKQSKFKNEYQKLLVNIIYTANILKAEHASQLKKFQITPEQYNVLRILRGQYPDPASVNLITERMLDKSSNASRLVEKLRVKKLLDRKECPEDRRSVNVLINDNGLELLKKLDNEEISWLENLKNINEKEAEQMNSLLDKLRG